MKGQILDYSTSTNNGIIITSDGKRYQFKRDEWKGSIDPVVGMNVDFEEDNNEAKSIYPFTNTHYRGTKNKVTAGLLAIFLGGWGIHKFYLGFTTPGMIFLLINTIGFLITWIFLFIPNYVLGLIAFIEGIIYLTKSDEDFEQTYVIQKKKWF